MTIQSISVHVKVEKTARARDFRGKRFTPRTVEYKAFITPEGKVLERETLCGEKANGEITITTTFNRGMFPRQPAWFAAAVDEMRASVRTPEEIARERFQQTLAEFAALGPDSDHITQGDN